MFDAACMSGIDGGFMDLLWDNSACIFDWLYLELRWGYKRDQSQECITRIRCSSLNVGYDMIKSVSMPSNACSNVEVSSKSAWRTSAPAARSLESLSGLRATRTR